jgi:hypothetical protein
MEVRNYNGIGKWSVDAITNRYRQYCRELKILSPRDLSPNESIQGNVKWIYPVMEEVITGIELGDAACRRIGIEFVEEDMKFPFGKILKSNTAKALRRCELTQEDQERIRRRVVGMLLAENVPHEFKQYAKLLKKIGVGSSWQEIENQINRSNKYVMRYYHYLKGA